MLQLHKKYFIALTEVLDLKFSQQYTDFLTVLKRIDHLVYKLKLLSSWNIHNIVSVVYLESITSEKDSFSRNSHESDSVITEDHDLMNDIVLFYKIERILTKRIWTVQEKHKIKYLVR